MFCGFYLQVKREEGARFTPTTLLLQKLEAKRPAGTSGQA
jgi:hypothetical protein